MSQPIVSVKQGKLGGKTLTNLDGKSFYGFQGISYAKPPIGELRFKAPQPPEAWSGVRDATKEGSECYSKNMFLHNIIGSEDCLFLNVYTHNIDKANNSLKPVMVWIHGGGFNSGSSKTDVYGPEYLMTEDIVLVTINYRLGILGFLQLEDPSLDVPGNAGLKDMIMALKWVQQNIKSFSGDPNNVTIFGESAGGASVHYLVLSPLAKGLFHKAIAQSGCALNPFAGGRPDIAKHVATILELKNPTERDILQRLQALPIEELFQLAQKIINVCVLLNNSQGRIPFAPLIEKPSPEAFISEEPIKIIKSGNYNQVPMIFGYTTREGMLVELRIRPNLPTMPKDFEALIPPVLNVERGTEASKNIADKMKQFYYGDKGSEDNIENFYNLHTDNYFFRDIWFSIQHHGATNKFPVYLYRMSIETRLNIFKKLASITAPGVSHGDDIGYLFKSKNTPPLADDSLEKIALRRFVKYWTNFAKYGNPNSKENTDLPEWKPVQKNITNFIDLGVEITAGVNPEPERVQFWREIYSKNSLYSI